MHWYRSPHIWSGIISLLIPWQIVKHRGVVVIGLGDCGASSDDPRYLKSAVLRILGTLVGATVSGFYLYFFSFNAVGMAVSIGLAVLLCQMVEVPDHGRLATITVALVMMISSGNPEFLRSKMRRCAS